MQELNVCILSGNVSEIHYAVTEKRGDDAASFTIYVDRDGDHTTVARVNVFGPLVNTCRDFRLEGGDHVIVEGELMNRRLRNSPAKALEVKASGIKVMNKARHSSNHSSDIKVQCIIKEERGVSL